MGSLTNAVGDLQAFCVPAGATVADAVQSLWQNGRGLAVVVDDADRALGTVTDSNIRRSVVGGHSLDSELATVMSERPVVAGPEAEESEILELLHAHRVRCIPVLDGGKLAGLWAVDGLVPGLPEPTAVVMAGGRGVRLRPLTDSVPKPLLKVGSTSMVVRIISALAAAGVRNVFLAVNYKAELFEEQLGNGAELGVNLQYLREDREMGTAGALTLLPSPAQGPVIVTNADILTTVDFSRLLDYHWRHAGVVTVAASTHLSHIPYGVLRTVEHCLLGIDEKPTRRDLCSAGIYILEPMVHHLLDPNVPCDMPNLIATVLAEGLPVHVFPILEEWYDIGGSAELERVLVQFATREQD